MGLVRREGVLGRVLKRAFTNRQEPHLRKERKIYEALESYRNTWTRVYFI